ncbi:hypothetical protein BC831DRAFT_540789 [Entophlyctis helioformis]|nr:hypothetical protein BC831DRAFT_540789 [Entophlyctis helioformis]
MEHANRELNDKIGRLAAEIKELRLAAGRQQEARETRAAPVPARSRQTAAAPAVPVARRNNKDAPPARVAFEADIADANTNDNEPVEAAPAAKTPVKKPSYAHVAAGKDQRIHEQHVANKSDKEKAAWSKLFQLVQQQKESRPQSHVPAKLEPKVENGHNKRVLFFDNAPFMPLKELRQTFSDVNLRTGAIFDIKYIGSTKLQVTCAANYAPTLIFELEKGSRCKHNAKYDPRSVRKNATPEERERYLTSFVNRTLDTIVNSRAAHVRNFYRELLLYSNESVVKLADDMVAKLCEDGAIESATNFFDLEEVPPRSRKDPVDQMDTDHDAGETAAAPAAEDASNPNNNNADQETQQAEQPAVQPDIAPNNNQPEEPPVPIEQRYRLPPRPLPAPEAATSTIFLYGQGAIGEGAFRALIQQVIGDELNSHIKSIKQKISDIYRKSFRIQTDAAHAQTIGDALMAWDNPKRYKWTVKVGFADIGRQRNWQQIRQENNARRIEIQDALPRNIMSWNVRGLVGKRDQVRLELYEQRPRVFALQETLLGSDAFKFTVRGYDVLQHPMEGPGKRGIALGLPSGIASREVPGVPGALILAKAPNFTPGQCWTIGSVYVGNQQQGANLRAIRDAVARYVHDDEDPILIMGDWNLTHQMFRRQLNRWGLGLEVLTYSGNASTRYTLRRNGRWTSIDHFVCNAAARALINTPRVNRGSDLSDHWIVHTSRQQHAMQQRRQAKDMAQHKQLERLQPQQLQQCQTHQRGSGNIAHSNYWQPLIDLDEEADVDTVANMFVTASQDVVAEQGLRVAPPERKNPKLFKRATRAAIKLKNQTFDLLCRTVHSQAATDEEVEAYAEAYEAAKREANELCRADSRENWQKRGRDLDTMFHDGRIAEAWRASRNMARWKHRTGAAATPLKDNNGTTQPWQQTHQAASSSTTGSTDVESRNHLLRH